MKAEGQGHTTPSAMGLGGQLQLGVERAAGEVGKENGATK